MKMNKKLVLLAAPVILMSNLGHADFKLGSFDLTSDVDLGGQFSSLGHKSSKFEEYRDIRTSVLAGAKVGADKDGYHMMFAADRIGLDDQAYSLRGGKYGEFKYGLYFDSIVHNYTFNAITFYSGIGTGNLSFGQVPSTSTAKSIAYEPLLTDISLWTPFDYSIKSKTYGINASYMTDSPFYFKWAVTQRKTDGTRPMGAAIGASGVLPETTGSYSGAQFVEIPEPVDYKTNNFSINTGYKGKDFLASVDGNLTKFTNGIPSITYQLPWITESIQTQTVSLAPDNTNWKIGAQGTYFHLPLDSTLAVRGSYSKATNNVTLLNSINHPGTQNPAVWYAQTSELPSIANFQGDNATGALNVAINSNPIEKLDTKVYYNFLRNWNNSPQPFYLYSDPQTGKQTVGDTPGRQSYYKHTYGLDASYRLPAKTRVGAGYEYSKTNRTSNPSIATISDTYPVVQEFTSALMHSDSNTDYTGYLEVKNSYLDFLSAKLRYQRLVRKATFVDNVNADANSLLKSDSLYGYQFMKPFYVAAKNEDSYKANLDYMITDDLDVNLDGIFKTANYTETSLGRLKDSSYQTYLGATYDIPKRLKTNVFASYEISKNADQRRVVQKTVGSQDPSSVPDQLSYNWNETETAQTYGYGINFEVPVNEKLDFSLGGQHQRNNGSLAFTAQVVPLSPGYNDINNLEVYSHNTVTAKAKYKFAKNLSGTIGYLFENLQYDDPQLDNYAFIQINNKQTNNLANFQTGAYTDQNYTAHTGYVMAEYTF